MFCVCVDIDGSSFKREAPLFINMFMLSSNAILRMVERLGVGVGINDDVVAEYMLVFEVDPFAPCR